MAQRDVGIHNLTYPPVDVFVLILVKIPGMNLDGLLNVPRDKRVVFKRFLWCSTHRREKGSLKKINVNQILEERRKVIRDTKWKVRKYQRQKKRAPRR